MQNSHWAYDDYIAGFYNDLKLPLEILLFERNNSSRCSCCPFALEEHTCPLRKCQVCRSV